MYVAKVFKNKVLKCSYQSYNLAKCENFLRFYADEDSEKIIEKHCGKKQVIYVKNKRK